MSAPSPDHADLNEARAYLRRIYRDISGYNIPRREEKRVRAHRSSPMYGEITFTGVLRLVEALELGPDDVLYDLGAGVGKMILQVAMIARLRACVGVELSRSRYTQAEQALARARADGVLATRSCSFRHGDLMAEPLTDATVVYTCSTAFSDRFLRDLMRKLSRLRPGLVFVTTRFPTAYFGFEEIAALRVDMSWNRRSPVYIYRLPERGA